MNSRHRFAAVIMLLSSLLCGCSNDDNNPDNGGTSLNVLMKEIEVSAKGGNSFTAYKLNKPLAHAQVEAVTDASWISDFKYDVEERISFKVAQNSSTDSREAVVKVIYPGVDPAPEFKVIQKGAPVYEPVLTYNVKGIKFDMILVAGGTFGMGATPEQKPGPPEQNEYPVHKVSLTDYYIAKYQVTQDLWEAVMGNNPSEHKGNPRYPVDNINWNDAQKFVESLNKLTDGNFAMPTEAQWEFAARGGVKSEGYLYCGSKEPENVAWFSENSQTTHEVGQLAPNELGLYDMSGNVAEWCQDWFGPYSSEDQADPKGPEDGSCRVWRGGGFFNFRQYIRTSFRGFCFPERANNFFGFRLVRNIPEE